MQPEGPADPWHSFFLEIDENLGSSVILHCFGGFAIAMLFGLPRPTVDIDCFSIIPVEQTAQLQSLAGKGSMLHKKHGVYLQHVGIVTVPENYADRLITMFPTTYRHLRFMGYDEFRPYLANPKRHDHFALIEILRRS